MTCPHVYKKGVNTICGSRLYGGGDSDNVVPYAFVSNFCYGKCHLCPYYSLENYRNPKIRSNAERVMKEYDKATTHNFIVEVIIALVVIYAIIKIFIYPNFNPIEWFSDLIHGYLWCLIRYSGFTY